MMILRPTSKRRALSVAASSCAAVFSCLLAGSCLAAEAGRTISYNRDIRPILSNNCFKCHGPDAHERQAGLRLDHRDDALRLTDNGRKAVVPGKPDKSALIKRIYSDKPNRIMPPPESNKKLTAAEKQLLKRWIEQGADYQDHWAFVPPKRPPLPHVMDASWGRNAIDRFILARLERDGLRPRVEADKGILVRRLTLDLTGLPPTPAEVDAFLADRRPDAYEALVERLLASAHFGERLAVDWLDAARFADTHGYHIDSGRDMTRWREWVINAFNRNMPFDQFTVEQLAGDLLPNATVEQRIASGFNRNHMINFEGGAIPAEYQTAYIVDRVNTTSTVWLGLTVGCAQCHDHKYDPITQKEYYQLYAFFHNVPENGLDGSKGNAVPVLKLPSPAEEQRLAELAAEIKNVEQRLRDRAPELDAAQTAWEKTARAAKNVDWVVLDAMELKSKGGATLTKLPDQSVRASGTNPPNDTYTVTSTVPIGDITALRLEALPDPSFAANGPGRSDTGNIVLTNVCLSAEGTQIEFNETSADFSQKDFPIANAVIDNPRAGWAIHPEVGKRHFAVFELAEPIRKVGTRLTVVLDFQSQFPQHQLGRFRLSVTKTTNAHSSQELPAAVVAALANPRERRTDQQKTELRNFFRAKVAPEKVKQLNEELTRLQQARADVEKKIPTAMVMQEMPQPRDTFMLIRGQYDKKGEKVAPGVPASLSPLPNGTPANRFGLARWLLDPAHPLTARVTVNRYWQMFFGTGLVKTAEDFGSQGEPPSHPELLDWLATEFVSPAAGDKRAAWDMKALIRLIVTSATYRQASAVTPDRLAKDPEDRLLSRGPRLRLQAEFIRDQALAISGLLNDRIGGTSVSPYQPPGLWEELASRSDGKNWTAQTYVQSHGRDLYRRTMYTFWKRTSPPPTLATFDAPDRETCTVRRPRTNTPLQALILMNDPTYVEASRKLAERMMSEPATPEERIAFAFRLATARRPQSGEIAVLRKIFDEQLGVYRKDRDAAVKLLGVGESGRNENLDPVELAAWATVASVILNLDETVTKG
jgi:hypothetical protein